MHELFCHGYQGVSSSTIENEFLELREDVDAESVWTEGWMDALAVLATEDWISQQQVPEWVMLEHNDLKTATRVASSDRYKPQYGLSQSDRSQREAANRSAMLLQVAFGRTPDGKQKDEMGKYKLLKLSLTLNALRIPSYARDNLTRHLGNAIEALSVPESDEFINILERFFMSHDWKWLDKEVLRLCGGG
jgi:hypothetical protein